TAAAPPGGTRGESSAACGGTGGMRAPRGRHSGAAGASRIVVSPFAAGGRRCLHCVSAGCRQSWGAGRRVVAHRIGQHSGAGLEGRGLSLPCNFQRLMLFIVLICTLGWLAGCSREPVNSPYPRQDAAQNVLHTAFTQRSPKHLDPASSYSTDETPFTYSIYEPLYAYHYLKRPYELIPKTAEEIAAPVYYDAQGNALPPDADGEQVAVSVYDIRIKPGILYQPHPAFARDDAGRYLYWPMSPEDIEGRYAITDFPETGTRELTAHDYVYAIRRLASPRVISPIFGVLAEHIVGMAEYGERLKALDDAGATDGQRATWLDLRDHGFDGVEAVDTHTLRIRVKGKYPQFRYWLAMTFTAPIPWEADRFYAQPGMAEHGLSFNTWPVGTGPYMMGESLINRRHVLERNPNFRGEPYPCEGEPG